MKEWPWCKFCEHTGTVTMTHGKHGYTTVFGCICEHGGVVSSGMGMVRWNGREVQEVKGEAHRLLFSDILDKRALPAKKEYDYTSAD